ncbi:MAG: S49 family peptidase [Desulfobulbales bacterium]|nr:S49 family peptidase [Desulfobulbales bacterium]
MSKHLPLIAARVLNTPLLITQTKLDAIMAVLGPRLGLGGETTMIDMENHKPDATMGTFTLSAHENGQLSGETATLGLITVHGTLVHRSGGMDGWSGLRSYASIREDFRELRADRTVQGIVFEYDSAGGEAAGLFDLVDELAGARGDIPMYAIVNEHCYSAAYALASAQDEIYLTRTAGAGSIGVRMRHVDRSRMNDELGLTVTELFFGERKLDGSPDQPLSDGARKAFTGSMKNVYDLFVATVARNRNMTEEEVRATEAACFDGDNAVSAGLADAVLSYDAALQRAADNIAISGGMNMSKGLQNQIGALLKGSEQPEIIEALAAHGYVPKGEASAEPDQGAIDQAKTAGQAEGRGEALAYAEQVVGLCNLAGLPRLASGYIKEGLSTDDVRQKLVDAQANGGDSGPEINSTVSATTTGKVSSLVENARARSDQAKA